MPSKSFLDPQSGCTSMPTITIDQQQVEVPAGATILDAAEMLGIEIPTLCYLKGYEPSTSCLVCVVRNRVTGQYVPACATRVDRRHADRQRDSRSQQHAADGPRTLAERSRGGLPGSLLLRLPRPHGHSVDAAADRPAERARGDRHDQAGHCLAGRARTRLPETVRERLSPQRRRQPGRRL